MSFGDAIVLTPRQTEVAKHLARGQSAKRVALELGVTADTIRAHIRCGAARLDGPGRPLHKMRLAGLTLERNAGDKSGE